MENTKKIHWLKAMIKTAATRQHLLKLGRKTVHNQEAAKAARTILGIAEPARCFGEALCGSIEVTAMLNLYHELRGSEYQHGIPKGWEYQYEQALVSLREEQPKSDAA